MGGGTPIFVENDANLGGLGETRMFKGIPTLSLYITISTGIGSGIIYDGKIWNGFENSEVGHIIVEYNDEKKE